MAVDDKTVCEAPADFGKTVCEASVDAPVPTCESATCDERYRIGGQIEFDPPFAVYEAVEIRTGKPVTLMRISPGSGPDEASKQTLFNRYVNSICAADERGAGENCPYIAVWFDPTLNDLSIEYLICESDYGQRLTRWLRDRLPLNEPAALYLMEQLLLALDAAHAPGCKYMGQGDFICGGAGPALVHRSVGTENIRILDKDGKPRLLLDGFDTALPAGEKTDEQFCGAPAFSPRQQLIDAGMPDPAWDVWAAAACLYYMLTGEHPRDLSGNPWSALLKNRPASILKRRPDLSPKLAAVIDRALDDSGELYYRSAKDFWGDLASTYGLGTQNMEENGKTVYEGDKTVLESNATVLDGGTTMLEAALSDAAERAESPASNAAIQKGSTILDTYHIESDAIEGGMGSVWRVHHKGWNVDLAMKRPQAKLFADEKDKANFIRECEAWINLGLHPNIVSCYYVREISGTPSIFSEWMDGGSLESAIQKETLYEGTEAAQQERLLDLAIQFARGLHYAHEAGLIHQDVKPDNVLLTKEGKAKVADFGLVRARAVLTVLEGAPAIDEPADGGKTMLSPSGGYTPAYCSMEQMDGRELTRRTDIYSWAVSVMEMCLGARPWANGVVAGLGCQGYFKNARVPLSKPFQALLAQCLESEPENRPHDFAEIEARLHEIYRAETGGAYPRPAPRAAADTADSLNNRALSFLDLGKPEEAERCWKRAMALAPRHSESLYNLNLHLWRSCRIDDQEALEDVSLGEEPDEYLKQIERERGTVLEDGRATRDSMAVLGHSEGEIFFAPGQSFIVDSSGDCYDPRSGDKLRAMESARDDNGERIDAYGYHHPYASCLSADGKTFFRANHGIRLWYDRPEEYMIVSWDTASGKPQKLIRNAGEIDALFYGGRDSLVAVCKDKTVRRWDAKSGRCIGKADIRCDISTLQYADPEGVWLLGAHKNEVRMIDVDGGECIRSISAYGEICALNLSPDGGRILAVSGGEQYRLEIWDVATGERVHSVGIHRRAYDVCISPDGKLALTREFAGLVRILDVRTGRCMQSFHGGTGAHHIALGFTPDGGRMYYAANFSVCLPATPTFGYAAPYALCRVTDTAQTVRYQKECARLAALVEKHLKKRDIGAALKHLEAYRRVPFFGDGEGYWALKAALEPYCVKRPRVAVVLMKRENPRARFEIDMSVGKRRSHGKLQLRKAKNGKVEVIHGETQEVISEFSCRNGNFQRIYFSPDGTKLLLNSVFSYSSMTNSIQVINSQTGEKLYHYGVAKHNVEHALFSPDGTRILCQITTSSDYARGKEHVVMLDASSGKPVFTIRDAQIGPFHGYALTPDGRYLIVVTPAYHADSRNRLKIFDLSTNERIYEERLLSDCATPQAQLSRDGSRLAIAGGLPNAGGSYSQCDFYQLDWALDFPGWADWDEGARPYLAIFLSLHPSWTDADFESLIFDLQDRGYGWLRPEGVRAKLNEMTRGKGG